MQLERLNRILKDHSSGLDFCSVRYLEQKSQSLTVRHGVVVPYHESISEGIMVTVHNHGGMGYAATADLTDSSIKRAFEQAREWAAASSQCSIENFSKVEMPSSKGTYQSPEKKPWNSTTIQEKVEHLRKVSELLKKHPDIVDSHASVSRIEERTMLVSTSGSQVEQIFGFVIPTMGVTAHKGGESVSRSLDGFIGGRQGGHEVLEEGISEAYAHQIQEEALELLVAPDCPTVTADLILDPGQMMLQIHESIGHPIELDRILGDERNYAGTSFVTMDMFGKFQYGSKYLNVTYDPTQKNEFASFSHDDEATQADKCFLIKDGILLRPLGGVISGHRAGQKHVANSRAVGWQRPPIDRMANLNLEPGNSSLDELIASVDSGVYMSTNLSWSIDDSRNKFQFGCEYARLIEGGKLKGVVKKPNYRGLSRSFWRSLDGVADASTVRALGTPYCGKGEPNQAIRVGHASPHCLFRQIEIFGGH